MRFEYLKIENFKAFECLEILFDKHSNFNIIYGDNGIGKTSILKALSVAAGSFFLRMSEVEKRNLLEDEVRMAMVMGKLEYQFPVTFSVKGTILDTPVHFVRRQNSFSGDLTEKEAKEITQLSAKAVAIAQNGREEILPLIAYFSSKRLFVNRKASSKDKRPLGRLIGYFNALNDSSINNEIEEWWGAREELLYLHISQGEMSYQDNGLQFLYNCLSSIFPDKYQVIKYFRPVQDTRYPSGIFLKDVLTQQYVPLNMLSDGYQNIYKLVLEIAWRCSQLNPFLDAGDMHNTPGVVLIDEIDLHLHPKFQEKIIAILKSAFPKIQFIVTTHSPLVLASAQEDVFILNGNKLEKQTMIYGKDASFVIRNFMHTSDRPQIVQQQIDQYFELINTGLGRTEDAKNLRKALDVIDDKLMAKADVILKFRED